MPEENLSLEEFAMRQELEIKIAANIFRGMVRLEMNTPEGIVELARLRIKNNKYLRGVGLREILPQELWYLIDPLGRR